jgi:hypothetical protein
MFFKGSRYANQVIETVKLPDGREVLAVRLPTARDRSILGFHERTQSQRLDHIAAHFLDDPTAFWRLCDANDAVMPDALASRQRIGIPRKGR